MKEIPLGNSTKVALVDDEDWIKVINHCWTLRPDGYAVTTIKGKGVRMHRLLLNATKGQEIDHKNRNGLDNQKVNLRFVTHSQNIQNSEQCNNTSGIKGVCWSKVVRKWHARIGGRHLGYFNTTQEAADAYNTAAVELYGQGALTN